MHYHIEYSCISHIGHWRTMNQDNYICGGQYLSADGAPAFPLTGTISSDRLAVFGVFDGMGGEECGEVASLLAAQEAASIKLRKDPETELAAYCTSANRAICQYARAHGVRTMGTTAAMLAFGKQEIVLCNVGDSKVFRLSGGQMKQISYDHVTFSVYGRKPALSQNLGIPEEEMIIEPYFARSTYQKGDVYLICSDGLTDMVKNDEIARILSTMDVKEAARKLVDRALENGGRDNITVILCGIASSTEGWFSRLFHKAPRTNA